MIELLYIILGIILFIAFFVACWTVGCTIFKICSKITDKFSSKTKNTGPVNYGQDIAILGHKFVNDGKNYYFNDDKSMWFFCENGVNYFGLYPNIFISQEQFLARLDQQ